jgi:MarR family transcriptional regulator for hemolysin
METAGLVTRTRDPGNRRVHRVELTEAGEAVFQRLLATVTAFDKRLRTGFTDEEIAVLSGMFLRLRISVAGPATVEVTS